MHISIGRRPAIAAMAGLGLSVALVVGASASPEPKADAPTSLAPPELGAARIAELDAQARASAAAGDPIPMFDASVGHTVDVPQDQLSDAERTAIQQPGYRDAQGNPRYVLVWRDGQFVPGPPLTCAPGADGGPATCTVEE